MIGRYAIFLAAFLSMAAPVAAADMPVKVFILAGRSNMQGHGFVPADPKRNGGKGSLEYVARDRATADRFSHLLARDGKWGVRDDVWIHYLDRVAFVSTKAFWRPEAVSPSGQAYHWNSNAETYYLIGEAMGTAMKKLCAKKSAS